MSPSPVIDLLRTNLESANKVAKRLTVSLKRVSALMPLDAARIETLNAEDKERLDANVT